MSDVPVPVWNCEFKEATGAGAAPLTNLTVGSLFDLHCKGDIPVEWRETPVTLKFAQQEQAYTLYLLKTLKLEKNEAEFVVTGYKAGKHNPEYVRILQGENGFEFLKPTWNIASVLKPNEQTQPYGPMGPWFLMLPSWIWVTVAILFIAFVTILVRFLRRRIQRKRMLEELDKHKTVLTPVNQFYRDSRLFQRRLHQSQSSNEYKNLLAGLNREFRLFVLREFKIPTLDWSDRAIVEDLRKHHYHSYRVGGDNLKKTLRELTRLQTQDQFQMEDLEQLHHMCMDAAEKLTLKNQGVRR
jgi:hypothetical protein